MCAGDYITERCITTNMTEVSSGLSCVKTVKSFLFISFILNCFHIMLYLNVYPATCKRLPHSLPQYLIV